MRWLALVVCLLVAGCGSTTTTVIVKTVVTGTSVTSATNATVAGTTETLKMPSGSMEPTIGIGKTITVSLDPTYEPQIGDIIVLHPPAGADSAGSAVCGDPTQGAGHTQACDTPTLQESSQTFVKRIVAGPGDVIAINNGHVIRNGQVESDSYIRSCGGEAFCTFVSPITIPAGEWFVMNDNRGASDDSRFWGPVPRAWIIGKVER